MLDSSAGAAALARAPDPSAASAHLPATRQPSTARPPALTHPPARPPAPCASCTDCTFRDTLRRRNGSTSSVFAQVVPWGNWQLAADLPFSGMR